ncbi:hypothetical protein [Reyranella sp.]|uniref:hypothetical protein n=1 Tax=Reyranella sp. TaxID=1929291 RepID=UPI003D0C3877
MVQTRALPAQDGHLMAQGDEFEFQCAATTNPELEQGTEGGLKREHVDDGITVVPKTLCFLGLFRVLSKHNSNGDLGRFRPRRPEKREDWDHFEQISLVS